MRRKRASTLGCHAFLLLLILGAWAEADAAGFNQMLAAQMFTAAYGFMLPRALDPITLPQLTIWGLRGITALDPALTPVLHDHDLTLLGPDHAVGSLPLPAASDMPGWGTLAAGIIAIAWDHSDTLARAGTEVVIASFFDEVFNHLDPYSRYVPPDAAATERDRRAGQAGIGVKLVGRAGAVHIAAVLPGSPAARAGLRTGSLLLAIDGARLNTDAAAAAALLEGPVDGSVTLELRRPGGQTITRSIPRTLVPPQTVLVSRPARLLVLQVTSFAADTADRMQDALAQATGPHRQPDGIVIDLRANRGGVLRAAVAAAGLFLTDGVIASTEGRDPAARHVFAASGTDQAGGLPLVVLVDGRSASAAEVLTAALEDNGRAVVVGSTTLGKGLVQVVGRMPDGGELFLTWSRLVAPGGWPMQGLGVMPEVCTSTGDQFTDAELAALDQGSAPMQLALAAHRVARPGLPAAEMLALRERCPAAIGTDADMDAARFLIAHPVAYATALAPRLRSADGMAGQ